ncbi:MAG: methylcobamide--CoM methyltransferase [Elusimicrobia bacterium]|nr:methylcobamide--CoM methyltransferase [Elusimicrobiota bacterium]
MPRLIVTAVNHYPKIPNLPRSAHLRQAIAQFQEGKISPQDLSRVQEEVTREVLQEQQEAGLDLVTDGQIRWEDLATYLAQGMEGFRVTGLVRLYDTNTYYRQPVAERKVSWKGPILVRDLQGAQKNSSVPVKAVLTGPYTLASLCLHPAYPRWEEFVLDLARALRQEIGALEAEGKAVWIQIDEPNLVFEKRPSFWPLFKEAFQLLTSGTSVPIILQTYYGGLDGLYPEILQLPFRVLGMDFVTAPANWKLLENHPFPKGKGLAAGIIDARNTKMESPSEISSRIERLLALCPQADPIHLQPHCGLEFLPRETAQRKLEILARAAQPFKFQREPVQ